MTPVVSAEHLTKRYGRRLAVHDVSLTVARGEVMGLLGPNGSGKTTFLRILAGYLHPTGGTARIAGLDVVADGDHLSGVDVVLDGELAGGDHTLGLVADVEQHLVAVDLDDGALDDVAVVEVLDGLVDGGEERLFGADVVDGDLGAR